MRAKTMHNTKTMHKNVSVSRLKVSCQTEKCGK